MERNAINRAAIIKLLVLMALLVTAIMVWQVGEAYAATRWSDRLQGVTATRDVTYAVVDGIELQLDIYQPDPLPDSASPVAVFIHGGGWRNGDKRGGARFAKPLTDAGYVLVSINYRLTGIAQHPAQIHDCKAAIRWVRANAADYGCNGERIAVFGTSAGGHLSALMGTSNGVRALEGNYGVTRVSSDVQAVCDWFGPADFTGLTERRLETSDALAGLLGDRIEQAKAKAAAASPVTYVDETDPPFLIIHGTEDPAVAFSQSEILLDVLIGAGVVAELIPVPSGGHGDFRETDPDIHGLVERMIAFFDEHLK